MAMLSQYRQVVTAAGTGLLISSICTLHFYLGFNILCGEQCAFIGQNFVYLSDTMLNLISRFISILCTAYSNAYFISKMFVSCFFILHQIVHQIIMGHGYKN